jgi:hypothetical protein
VTPLLRERVLARSSRNDPGHADLHDEALRDAALEARRNARLARSITALAAAGIPSLVFKGTALAHRHYPRPELRPRDDTDLLIRRDHLEVAHAVLEREGFTHIEGVEGSLIMRQRLYRHLGGDGPLNNLDLHWAVTNEPRAGAFEARALLAASEPLPTLSPHARAPGDAEALLLACLHLDAHHSGQVRLIWLYDVDRLLDGLDGRARRRVSSLARQRRIEAPCAWVLTATRALFGTSLTGFESLLESSPAHPPASGRGARWWRDLSRLPGSTERLRWMGQHLFPSAGYLRQQSSSDAPAWRLYAGRALRGVGHLLGR